MRGTTTCEQNRFSINKLQDSCGVVFLGYLFNMLSYSPSLCIPYSFNSWRHALTQLGHLLIAWVALLRWRVYPRVQSRISAGVRKLLIYAPTSLQWVKWIGYSEFHSLKPSNTRNKFKVLSSEDQSYGNIHELSITGWGQGQCGFAVNRVLWDYLYNPYVLQSLQWIM